MIHLPDLIQDLAFILMTAAIVTLLFKKLKQPVVLGYLIAGLLVGPHFSWTPSVRETRDISIWAEIGVIFMLFGLGLEFSFKKLVQVGKSATITASFEIFAMLVIGYVAGQLMGWSRMDSLFLGGILSISSTTIIVRAFDELGLKGRGFVSLVFGVLIVEDLIAILLLVLLSSVAATQSLSGSDLAYSSLRLGFFLVLWFLLGIYLLPIFFNRFRSLLSDETMLIVSVALCLVMGVVASHLGFSPALGAFVMGSILAETREGHRIERLILPVKDLFSAVFFVSVGMLIDPGVLREHWKVILLMTVLTIAGKLVSTTIGALLSGRSFRHSVQAGMSLAQIGEFSFIIATLGISLKVTSDFLYPIAVAVSAVTTFTTPYLIQASDKVCAWLEKRLPDGMKESLARYEAAMAPGPGGSVVSLLWKEYGVKVALNSVIVVGLTLAMRRLALPRIDGVLSDLLPDTAPTHLLVCAVTLMLAAPFFWAIFAGGPKHAMAYAGETAERLRRLQIGVLIARILIGSVLTGFVVGSFTSVLAFSGVLLIVFATVGAVFFSRFSEPLYQRIESRFLSNLTENERLAIEKKAETPVLAPWDATLAEFMLSPNSPLVAKSLQASGLKEKFGVTIAMIERGEKRILAPQRGDLLLPGDKLFLIGTDEQLLAAREMIEPKPAALPPPVSDAFGLTSLVLLPTDRFVGRPIRECGLREAVNGLIVGIERDNVRLLSPDSSMTLMAGDLIWLVGDQGRIRGLREV
jgi:CPA2 family monovalent cation:H+ antiporter-2